MSMLMHAQNCDIVLRPLITQSTNEDGSRYPQVVDYLTNRLRVLTSEAGGVGGMENSQFALAFDYDVIDKQIVSGVPTKIVYKVNVSMHVVDLKAQKVYATYSKGMKGIGDTRRRLLLILSKKLMFRTLKFGTSYNKGSER